MLDVESALERIVGQMRAERLPPQLVAHFSALYRRFRAGETGRLSWTEIDSPAADDITDFRRVVLTEAYRDRGASLLDGVVAIRLNGGLGTSMELKQAKSLINVREGQSFLDVIAAQVRWLRSHYGARLPLLLMDSFATHADSMAALGGLAQPDGLPLSFLQHKVPRIDVATGGPAVFASLDEGWAPPGHGDLYLALSVSGLLQRLIALGYTWAFVSNADNLGATVNPAILGYLDAARRDFAMEVTPKTLADRKGGTLVQHEGRLTLLERAQVSSEHLAEFEDIQRFRVFNTNSLWFRLDALAGLMASGGLRLPMIVNPKQIEGTDVVQLETAMGAAIGSFDRAVGILVGRERFSPVKTTSDLLSVRSDAYVLDETFGLRLSPERDPDLGPPDIRLDARYYHSLDAFEQRIPHPPSLVACRELEIVGDVTLGRGVVISGEVTLRNDSGAPVCVDGGTVLDGRNLSWR